MTPATDPTASRSAHPLAPSILQRLRLSESTVATAESLTGGLVVAALTEPPGASAVVRGGVVAYHEQVKESVLDVPGDLLARYGAVDAEVAEKMAINVAHALASTYGLATTGVAGPGNAPGGRDRPDQLPGTVFIAVAGPHECLVEQVSLAGTRADIRAATVDQALTLLDRILRLDALNEA